MVGYSINYIAYSMRFSIYTLMFQLIWHIAVYTLGNNRLRESSIFITRYEVLVVWNAAFNVICNKQISLSAIARSSSIPPYFMESDYVRDLFVFIRL